MAYSYNPIVGENWRYNPEKTFKISRSKIELYFNCPTCFYKDAKIGLRKPPMPGWAINSAVDDLLKKEMDYCRSKDRPHGIFKENGLNIKPFQHEDIEKWQHTFTGIQFNDEKHNFLIYGGVDDIMIDEEDKLVVVDFKATAKKADILTTSDVYNNGESYKRQLEIYSWLLQKNNFDVSITGYLMYYNGDASKPHLGREMYFRRTLVPFNLDTSWIDPMVDDIYECLQKKEIPKSNENCEECIYLKTVSTL
tara:strand:+ start:1318 stop:2070 length:753 start_codon:yes stop_codon:yes gene_type:complete